MTIVRHLSSGATDRDIAERLGLSPRTISNTLSKLYDRLGVSSRAYVASLYLKGKIAGSRTRRSRRLSR
jgi:DNA-binding CsgD family transcriptional regulator